MTDTDTLDLEVLKKQYETILLQYNQAQADYIQYLQNETTSKKDKYTDIKGKAFWGTKTLSEQSAENIDQCKSICSSLSGCTGATYNLEKKYCWLRSGEGSIVDGNKDDYAIIPERIRLMKVLQNFSKSLTALNEKIVKQIEKEQPSYDDLTKESQEQLKVLKKTYSKLVEERKKIDVQLSSFDDLNQGQHDSELTIRSYRSFYIISIIGVLFVISLFGRQFVTVVDNQEGPTVKVTMVLFALIVFLFVLAIPYLKRIRRTIGV